MGDPDHFLQEVRHCFLGFLTGIHKETPMFWPLFQEKPSITLGILKGFWRQMPVFHGKQWFPGGNKTALQGAANHQKLAWE